MASTHSEELARALASGYEEAVEVNQRGLIEKILARYSGQHTVFRELSQNADDAQAISVQIHFQTERNVPVTALTTEPIVRIVIKNDGIVFREEDWKRLKTIADGQPNVESIGAFGVGFYSIWSLSDQPLVVSGENMMEFVWRGHQLAVRRAKNPSQAGEVSTNGRPWSSISMPCRDREPMPDPADFSKFLATALPFTAHIRSMSLHFNNHELCRLEKLPAPPKSLSIPSHMNLRSPQRLMAVTQVESTPVQMTCRIMRVGLASLEAPSKRTSQAVKQSFATKFLSFATSNQRQVETPLRQEPVVQKDPTEVLSSSLFLSIVTAHANITASPAFISEIERSTKKPPPTKTRLQILFTSKDEADASQAGESTIGAVSAKSIFGTLTSNTNTQGKIYIGFPLFQTTGCASAISSRLIPTVEREQIDLNAKAIADYNRELLALSGSTCRVLYDHEMMEVASKLSKLGATTSADDPAHTWLESQAIHLMQSFTFYQSTPIAEIGQIVQRSFFAANTRDFLILSTKGVIPSSKCRLPAPELGFLTGLPTISDQVAKGNTLLLEHLQERNLISPVTIDDVVKQLNEKPLTAGQTTSALQWWIGLSTNANYDPRLLPRFRDALIISVPAEDGKGSDRVIPFGTVKHYLNSKNIPPDMPMPSSVLPYSITRAVPWNDLQRTFNLSELSIPEWTRYITSKEVLEDAETSVTLSPHFAEKTLGIIAKAWSNLRPEQCAQVITALQPVACIPTKHGMQKPAETYLPRVTLFEDLPVTTMLVKGNMEKLFKTLGVRSHVDLALVFSRLLGGGEWDQEQVAKYLVSVSSSLSADEMDRLKKTAWLSKEASPSTAGDSAVDQKPTRYKARSLYEPNGEALRALGLPILAWKSKWRPTSDEARMLYGLGLQKFPMTDEVLQLAAESSDTDKQGLSAETRKRALAYFLGNYDQYAVTYQPTKHNYPFVPVLRGTVAGYAKPLDAYSSTGSSVMGFPMLQPEYQLHAAKFKIASDPRPSELVAALLKAPPATKEAAIPIYAYLAGQASRFTAAEHNDLAFARFIPAQTEDGGPYSLYAPRSVYFQSSESTIATQFRSLFVFVDFPSTAANAFLLQVGVRAEPTIAEITQLLLADPKRFLTLAGSSEKYIALLRQIASQYSTFSSTIRKRMVSTAFLLGFERIKSIAVEKEVAEDDEEEDEGLLHYKLALASELVVIDDSSTLIDFRDQILTCPQDDLIEAFVEQLGGKRISKLVTTSFTSSTVPDQASPRALSLRKLILERVTLFLHERQQTSKDVRYGEDWLRKNLEVKEVARIERQRTLTTATSRFVKSSTASAAATVDKGTLLLRISSNLNDLDYYEVAAALTKHLLSKQKIHDCLLFMTLLQTSLRDLKRRGFNIDRIMNARRAEQEASEEKQRQERTEAEQKRIKDVREQETRTSLPPSYSDADSSNAARDEKRSLLNDSLSGPPPPISAPPNARSLFSNLRNKLKANNPLVPPMAVESMGGQSSAQDSGSPALPPIPATSKAGADHRPPGSQVTPTSSIATNVLKAVGASRPDRSGNITSEANTELVKESSGYCDSTPANDLDYITDVIGVRFYVSRSVDPDQNILQKHQEAIKRYISQIIKPVGNVFNVDPKALHVFYDGSGPLIAFNRSGSLFFNLRFHLSWHGEQVKNGNLSEALISTYFSMAHELAHNLVLPHNSEHSFYTSSISQTFFLAMAAHIAEVEARTTA